MTGPRTAEHELAVAVTDALLREDYGGLSRQVRAVAGGLVLELPGGPVLPLRPDGFLADFRVAWQAPPLTLADVRAAVDAVSDARDADGVRAFRAECDQALAALRLRERHLPAARARLTQAGEDGWLGPAGAICYEALAAALPHPAYPTSACRLGFSDQDSLRYAPEYLPEFELNWVAVPRSAVVRSPAGPATGAGRSLPPWWPDPAAVGLPAALAGTHHLMPVHPLTARLTLSRALAEAGLAAAGAAPAGDRTAAVAAPGARLRVRPTLSTRTVAVTGHPAAHLKLPLPASTLGLRNRRSIKPGTLADGALVRGILAAAVATDAELGRLLLADDGDYAHAGHPYLGYLLRRLPEDLGQCRIVPVAALLAPAGPGRLVIDDLAAAGSGGSLTGCFRGYLDLVFGIAVRLFARYGIALESHQQNAAVVLGPSGLRLLVKDFDGALLNYQRLAAALGPAAPAERQFSDGRMLTGSDDAVADVFITITVHLCAGALAFGLAERGRASLPDLLRLVRRSLAAALDRQAGAPASELLRARVFDAARLPVKAMVTAGTLMDKSQTGAGDINKFYRAAGPNYLRPGAHRDFG